MIRILEEIIRDPDPNPTAKCTAIRTLREFPQQPEASARLSLEPGVLASTTRWPAAGARSKSSGGGGKGPSSSAPPRIGELHMRATADRTPVLL
jgi:hypothetical protein